MSNKDVSGQNQLQTEWRAWLSAAKFFLAIYCLEEGSYLKQLWVSIGSNRCRQRSTTKKPAMESELIPFQHFHLVLKVLNFSVFNWFKSVPAAFHNQQARNVVRTSSVSALAPEF